MDQTPDHRSETAGENQSKRVVFRFMADRSKEIIERRVPKICAAVVSFRESLTAPDQHLVP